jgi:hypothetical protein
MDGDLRMRGAPLRDVAVSRNLCRVPRGYRHSEVGMIGIVVLCASIVVAVGFSAAVLMQGM